MKEKVKIVAEFSCNHCGDLGRLSRMIDLAAAAGADLIKVQKRDVDTFYSKEELANPYFSPFGATLRDYRKGIELETEGFELLDRKCRELGVGWFASVLDVPSLSFLERFHAPMIKIPSTISDHKDFHDAVAEKYDGTLIISTGYTDKVYEDYVLEKFKRNKEIYLLQTTSAYPTPIEDCHVSVVRHYWSLGLATAKIKAGYSSHDPGALGSMLAVAAGAVMVEKHVKLGVTEWLHFDEVALDLETEFAGYVRDVRKAELMCGSAIKEIRSSEHHKYKPKRV